MFGGRESPSSISSSLTAYSVSHRSRSAIPLVLLQKPLKTDRTIQTNQTAHQIDTLCMWFVRNAFAFDSVCAIDVLDVGNDPPCS
jgi:hypothetical protein